MAQPVAVIGAFRRPFRAARAAAPAAKSRRRSARLSLAAGGLLFLLFTLAVECAAETVKPEWRDPEYGHRLRQLREWRKGRPDRPLVLVLGSSRAQMGVSPAAMGFADRPGSPLVYNFGYRGAFPLAEWLQLVRLLDEGVRPAAVLVLLGTVESKMDGAAEDEFPLWGSRYSPADLRRLAPYTLDRARCRRGLASARRNPWAARRELIVSDLAPGWQPAAARSDHEGWERMDRYGHTPFPEERLTEQVRRAELARGLVFAEVNAAFPTGQMSHRAVCDMAARCRAEGVALAVAWAPESPAYRAAYTPAARATREAYGRALAGELGLPVFPAPDDLAESEFADGYHLLPGGAEKYSRWLADHHLKPWLAQVLK
jgi:hypothetical protein